MVPITNLLGQTSAAVSVWHLASRKEFHRLLACERALADRNQRTVSVIKIQFLAMSRPESVIQMIANGLDHSNHILDRAGWVGRNEIAIILPATGCESATRVAQAIALACNAQTRSIQWRVETYPDHRKQRKTTLTADRAPQSSAVPTSGSPEIPGRRPQSIQFASDQQIDTISPCPRWKRAMDIAGAGLGLLALSPLLLAVALWIKCVSAGPVFFRQRRFGLGGRPFAMWKFRTLEIDELPSTQYSYVSDLMSTDLPFVKRDRELQVIRGGSLFRKLGLDELPQLFNVLKGEMSLVGPRPDVVPFQSYAVWQRRRFDVVPGITGLWQVSGKNQTTFSTMMSMDIAYVRRRSLAPGYVHYPANDSRSAVG